MTESEIDAKNAGDARADRRTDERAHHRSGDDSPASAFAVVITNSAWGSLSATTAAGASCTARARYASGNYSAAAGITAIHVADSAGTVSWTYTRTSTTTKGVGTHTVTCTSGGATLSASAPFTVP